MTGECYRKWFYQSNRTK